jgi:outer membrane protein OmpA-like peptidoglycan-associated protein
MKRVSIHLFKNITVAITVIFASVLTTATSAKTIFLSSNKASSTNTQHATIERDEDLDMMSLAEMLNSVPIDKKSSELIQKFQTKEARNRLLNKEFNKDNNCNVEFTRNKEVLVVTIPADKLFAPNDTIISSEAIKYLNPLKRYLKEPDMYRVLLVMHTDNTGSEKYRDMLTESRSSELFDWFDNQDLDTSYLFSYGMGDDQPLYENDSMTHRAANRRLEVYLMPGKKMLEQAKKGRIIF